MPPGSRTDANNGTNNDTYNYCDYEDDHDRSKKKKKNTKRGREVIGWKPDFFKEDGESDEEDEHVSSNDDSEKESDTEDTLSMAPSPFMDVASAQTLSHPPGYTPPCSLAHQEGVNGDVVANVEVGKLGDSSRPDVIIDQQLSITKKDGSGSGGGNVNDIVGPPVQSQSILKRLDELVEVGQAMGFNMEGCLKNMEYIIGYHGNQNSFQ
ncbi:hypothetical protein L1887_24968 [Cichorium endivia]|nr:hypothetical protein L1887_24968 [Cichorium endivia]